MNKRFLYTLCLAGYVFMSFHCAASQMFRLGFAKISINSVGCDGVGSIQVTAQSDDPTRLQYVLTSSSGTQQNNTGLFLNLNPGNYTITLIDPQTGEQQQAGVVVSELVPLTIRRIQIFNATQPGGAGFFILETRGRIGPLILTELNVVSLLNVESLEKLAHIVQDERFQSGPLAAGTYRFSIQTQDGCPPTVLEIQIVAPQ